MSFGLKGLTTNWKRVVLGAGVAIALLGAGILAGYAIGVAAPRYRSGSGGSSGSEQQDLASSSTGSRVEDDPSRWQELPPPGSAAARLLLEQPDTPGWVRELYAYQEDSQLITAEATRTFLQQLQRQLPPGAAAGGIQKLVEGQEVPAASNSSSSNSSSSSSSNSSVASDVDLSPFIRVAFDVLNYLRSHRSEAVLLLLREFARSGSLALDSVDPDELRGEVQHLFNVSNLQRWYLTRTRADSQSTTQQQGGRRLRGMQLPPKHLRRLQQLRSLRQQQLPRRLQQAAASSAPADPASILLAQMTGAGAAKPDAAATGAPASTAFSELQQQAITDMLCQVRGFSPSGLRGVLPAGDEACPAQTPAPPATQYSPELPLFKPVRIPVVFHVFRFLAGNGTLLPPGWQHEAMARNMINESNRLYRDSGIEFVFREVRNNPQQYAYLNKASLRAWQDCTYNLARPKKGLNCLARAAREDEVAELVSQRHAINVFIAGSRQPSYCGPEQGTTPQGNFMRRRRRLLVDEAAPACSALALGETTALGPWWPEPSAAWSEDNAEGNWIYISWDEFDADTSNSQRFWNGGACTLSHELGHYLGLLHPHQEAPSDGPCGPTDPDAVADTPINLRVDQFAASHNLLAELSGWCAEFRSGSQPPARDLAHFNSCGKQGSVDNVFNLMSYVPDACCMLLTDIQVQRLQWAIASFRPKMMEANAAA